MRAVARALYEQEANDDEELLFWGLTRADVAAADVEVWPDNWDVVGLFTSLNTQWRTGFGGATGLDYGALPAVLRMCGMKRDKWPELFQDLRVLEAEALATMREK